jgi:hypothetical protein
MIMGSIFTITAEADNQSNVKITQIKANKVSGTCDDVSKKRHDVGVQDGKGNTHPSYAGWTEGNTSYSSYKFDYKRDGGQKVKCGCTGKTYDSASACTNECKASLACFTGICSPVDGGPVCLTTTKVDVTFKSNAKAYGLSWKPGKPISAQCNAEKNRWENDIKKHESKHVQDIKDVAKKANDDWKSKSYKACAETESAAKQKLDEQIKTDLDNEITEMKKEIDKKSEEFHKTKDSEIKDPDCSICK